MLASAMPITSFGPPWLAMPPISISQMRKTEGHEGEVSKTPGLTANPRPPTSRAAPGAGRRQRGCSGPEAGSACQHAAESPSQAQNPGGMASFVGRQTPSSTCKAMTSTRARFLPFQGFERLDDVLRVAPKKIHLDGDKGRRERPVGGKPSLHLHASPAPTRKDTVWGMWGQRRPPP